MQSFYITEGTVIFVPRINGLDDFGRHCLTIIPDDQELITQLEQHRIEKLNQIAMTNNLTGAEPPRKAPWRWQPDNDPPGFSLGFNWKPEQLHMGKVHLFDEHDERWSDQYTDKQLQRAKFKLSFELASYAFSKEGDFIYGTSLRPRKIKLLEVATFSDFNDSPNEPELAAAGDF